MIRFGEQLIRLDVIDSTNKYAAELLKSHPKEGTVISCNFQTNGQGQAGNTWSSDPGMNLLISIIIYPEFLKPERIFFLNQFVSLALMDFLKICLAGIDIQIKWPNDILAGKRKIAGILINNVFESAKIKSSVIGIGLNINQTGFNSQLFTATSLKILTGKEFDLEDCLKILLSCLESRYFQLIRAEFDTMKSEYIENLYLYRQDSCFIDKNGKHFTGKIQGVEDDGMLKILSNGMILRFNFKEFSFNAENEV